MSSFRGPLYFCIALKYLLKPNLRIDGGVGTVPDLKVKISVAHDRADLADCLAGSDLSPLLDRNFLKAAVQGQVVSVADYNALAVAGHLEGLDYGALEDGLDGLALRHRYIDSVVFE